MSHADARSSGPAQTLRHALDGSEPLSQLLARVQASRDCLAAVMPVLPQELRGAVQAGPLDDSGWTLLVANASVAAKLRQLLPSLNAALQARSLAVAALRVKIHTPK
jgi:hypothetical protein